MNSILDFLEPESDEPGEPKAPADGQEPAPDDDFDELELPAPRRINKVTAALSVGLLLVGAFIGGIYVQKNHGSTPASAAGANPFPGGGTFPGFGGARPSDAGNGASTGTTTAAAGPVVVGQVVSGSGTTVTVRNFGGKLITVSVPEGTSITSATSVPLSAVKPGTTVSVVGTSAANGKVTATAVTTRPTG